MPEFEKIFEDVEIKFDENNKTETYSFSGVAYIGHDGNYAYVTDIEIDDLIQWKVTKTWHDIDKSILVPEVLKTLEEKLKAKLNGDPDLNSWYHEELLADA